MSVAIIFDVPRSIVLRGSNLLSQIVQTSGPFLNQFIQYSDKFLELWLVQNRKQDSFVESLEDSMPRTIDYSIW
jgi:hypothetical protein